MSKKVIFLSAFIFFGACSRVSVEKDFYKSGKIREINTYKGEVLHGETKAYYSNGNLQAVGYFENGRMVGEWSHWYEDGSILSVAEYDNGKLVDLNAWNENGVQTIKNCSGTGKILYTGTEKVQSIVSYKSCKPHGKWQTFFENEQKESETEYNMGMPLGEWKFWNYDGTLQKIVYYENGRIVKEENHNTNILLTD